MNPLLADAIVAGRSSNRDIVTCSWTVRLSKSPDVITIEL